VTAAGFKPTTTCLEGRSSIQLSYAVINRRPARPHGKNRRENNKNSREIYSIRKLSTGLATAALTARRLMVNSVIASVSAAANANIHQLILTR
jgi:hypothetical protein